MIEPRTSFRWTNTTNHRRQNHSQYFRAFGVPQPKGVTAIDGGHERITAGTMTLDSFGKEMFILGLAPSVVLVPPRRQLIEKHSRRGGIVPAHVMRHLPELNKERCPNATIQAV